MKNKLSFWAVTGIVIATAVAVTSGNLMAALFIGTGIAMLLMIVTNLEVERKIRN